MSMSKEKGARGETQVRDYLRQVTGLEFERTPMSGASSIKGMKGDLFIPNYFNKFTVEVKFYEGDELGSLVLGGKGVFKDWWEQAIRQAKDNNNSPMVIYKWNRSKLYLVVGNQFDLGDNYIEISRLKCKVYMADEVDLKKLMTVEMKV